MFSLFFHPSCCCVSVCRNDSFFSSLLLTPKEARLFNNGVPNGAGNDKTEKVIPWKILTENIANPRLKTLQRINDEAEVDIRSKREIALTLKNEAMRMEMNCGFRVLRVRERFEARFAGKLIRIKFPHLLVKLSYF